MSQLTPFQFSSNKLQTKASLGGSSTNPLGNLISGSIGNILGETTQTMSSWYEMWINPAKIDIQDRYIQTRQHTAGGIVTWHYRQDVKVIDVEGQVGWIQIQSEAQSVQSNSFNLLKGDTRGFKQSLKNLAGSFNQGVNLETNRRKISLQLNKWNPSSPFGLKLNSGRHSNSTNNSPRLFLQRLKDLADEPMYYFDDSGLEHHNVKYIKMYTKQFPNGIIAEGYFTEFKVPETSDDSQTVNYSFNFIAENMKPVTITQRVAGMFTGSTNLIGDAVRLLHG